MLEQRILDTLLFFSFQGIPLTLFELHKFLLADREQLSSNEKNDFDLSTTAVLPSKISPDTIYKELQSLQFQGLVYEQSGYFALASKKEQVQLRLRGHWYGALRERKIRRTVKYLKYLPFVEAVGITGSQAMGLEKKGSDIDLFIVTKPGWMWTARTLVTAYFQILGIRRYGEKVANRMCLNHYLAGAKRFDFGKNLYTALEYGKLRPVFGTNVFHEMQEKNRDWIRSFFPNWQPVKKKADQAVPKIKIFFEGVLGSAGFIEKMFKSIQKGRIQTSIKFIVVEEDELSFHPNSKQDSLLKTFFEFQK